MRMRRIFAIVFSVAHLIARCSGQTNTTAADTETTNAATTFDPTTTLPAFTTTAGKTNSTVTIYDITLSSAVENEPAENATVSFFVIDSGSGDGSTTYTSIESNTSIGTTLPSRTDLQTEGSASTIEDVSPQSTVPGTTIVETTSTAVQPPSTAITSASVPDNSTATDSGTETQSPTTLPETGATSSIGTSVTSMVPSPTFNTTTDGNMKTEISSGTTDDTTGTTFRPTSNMPTTDDETTSGMSSEAPTTSPSDFESTGTTFSPTTSTSVSGDDTTAGTTFVSSTTQSLTTTELTTTNGEKTTFTDTTTHIDTTFSSATRGTTGPADTSAVTTSAILQTKSAATTAAGSTATTSQTTPQNETSLLGTTDTGNVTSALTTATDFETTMPDSTVTTASGDGMTFTTGATTTTGSGRTTPTTSQTTPQDGTSALGTTDTGNVTSALTTATVIETAMPDSTTGSGGNATTLTTGATTNTGSGGTTLTTATQDTTSGTAGSDSSPATQGSTVVTIFTTTPVISDLFSTTESSTSANTTDTTSTSANTTDTTVLVTTAAASGGLALPWYIIAIICMGIVILILIIVFIVICCLYQKASNKPETAQNGTIKNGHTEEKAGGGNIKMQSLPVVSQPQPMPPPVVPKKQETTSFISETPMPAPVSMPDPTASVRKREVRPRIDNRTPSSDEGFNEPLLKKMEKDHKPAKKKPPVELKSVRQRPPQDNWADGSPTSASGQRYEPYYFPPPVKSAMVSNALGDALKDDAEAHKLARERSDIERHRNKQRMRKQRAHFANEAYKDVQRDIDRVLVPPPPGVFQVQPRKRHHKKHGQLVLDGERPKKSNDVRLVMQDGGGTYKDRMSDTEDTSTGSDRGHPKRAEQEATIARMTKLLEQVYTLLAPSVQKNTVSPVLPQQAVPRQVQPQGQHTNVAPMGQDDLLFTRTQPSPFHGPNATALGQAPNVTTGDDSNSVVWTPYRAFDQIMKLQAEDPSFVTQGPDTGQGSFIHIPSPQHHRPVPPERTMDLPPSIPGPGMDWMPGGMSAVPGTMLDGSVPGPSQGIVLNQPGPNRPASNHQQGSPPGGDPDENPYLEGGSESPTSIVQSIKDTLSRLAGSSTPVHELTSVEPR